MPLFNKQMDITLESSVGIFCLSVKPVLGSILSSVQLFYRSFEVIAYILPSKSSFSSLIGSGTVKFDQTFAWLSG